MPEFLFRWSELFESINSMGAVVVAAFVQDGVDTGFPAVEGSVTMRAVIFGLGCCFITIVGVKV